MLSGFCASVLISNLFAVCYVFVLLLCLVPWENNAAA